MKPLKLAISAVAVLMILQGLPAIAQRASQQRPLAAGIADVQARIAKNQELANELDGAASEHAITLGEILYSAYGQKGDPGVELVKLKQAYEGVRSAIDNGLTGQVWPAVGQLGQSLLDFGAEANPTVNSINAFQQMGWELARLKVTLGERDGYNEQIARDTQIEQTLESKSADLAARQDQGAANSNADAAPPPEPDVVLPKFPANVDLSALDEALLMNRWLDLGNRAFQDKTEEDKFYSRFPAFQKFRNVAETQSPRTDVERAARVSPPASNTATKPHSDDWLIQLCAQTSDPPGNIFWSAAGCDKIGSPNKNK